MSFGAPLLLLGLLGAAIPIAIHLINRRRAVRVPFPALEFLIRSNEKLARRLKVKQWLLLALRIGLFVLVPLAMARPSASCGGGPAETPEGRLPASVVIVLDDSASVAREGAWADVAEDAAELVRRLRPWDRVAIVRASARAEVALDWTEDRNEALRMIEDWQPEASGSEVVAALRLAAELQDAARMPARRTVVVSDGQRATWEAVGDALPAGIGALTLMRPEDGASSDCAIVSLEQEVAERAGTGDRWVSARVVCEGLSSPRDVSVAFDVDGRSIGARPVALTPDSPSGTAALRHLFEGEGPFLATARLDDGGPVDALDTRAIPVDLDRTIRVLLVNGDVRSVAYNDEIFYLQRALEVGAEGQSSFEVTTRSPEGLAEADPTTFDVIVLANVATLPPAQVARVEAAVRGGAGLWITGGDHVDPERWNGLFRALLPKPIRSVRMLSERDDPDASIKATRFATSDATHPALRVFHQAGGESLQSSLVYRYILFEPDADSTARTILSFGDGAPGLVEHDLDQGRVWTLTTSIDFDWTDLPIRTAYLPLVQEGVRYLARRGGSGRRTADVGELVPIDVAALSPERLVVIGPDGDRNVVDLLDGRGEFRPRAHGYHQVSVTVAGAERRLPSLDFAAAAPAGELSLERLPDAVFTAWHDGAGESIDGEVVAGVPAGSRPLWPLLLFFAVLAIYAESLVSIRRRFWVKLRGRRRPSG